MIIATSSDVAGYTIAQTLGLVVGNTVRAKHLGKDIMAGFKQLVGGEIKGYTEMLTEARNQATGRMIESAAQLGADAVVNVRYMTSAVMASAAEILAYGTAVKLAAKQP
jgi:uncharacterized protein YbjQ (UPF0145 family)